MGVGGGGRGGAGGTSGGGGGRGRWGPSSPQPTARRKIWNDRDVDIIMKRGRYQKSSRTVGGNDG